MSFKISAALAVIALVALLLSFAKVADAVANLLGGSKSSSEKSTFSLRIQETAKTILAIAVGAFLITSGVAALAFPVVGVALIVVGLAIVAYAAWPWLKSMRSADGG